MGADIHPWVEVKVDGVWEYREAPKGLEHRNYTVFGFLTGGVVRPRGYTEYLPEPRAIRPPNCSEETKNKCNNVASDWGNHSFSWLTLTELLAVDYMQLVEDGFRVEHVPLGTAIGPRFMGVLDELKAMGAPEDVRIIFYFDS